jgi:drug/metabolite transporter (DMT)-like permease
VGVLGVVMLTQGVAFQASTTGLIAIAAASLTWSIGSVMSQRRWTLAPGAMGFASEMLAGGAVLMLMAFAADELPVAAAHWPFATGAVLAWVYLVVFGSLIAFNAYMILLARAPAALASSYALVNPVIAMLLGVSLGGEAVSGFEWGATAVVLAGVVLLLLRRRAS